MKQEYSMITKELDVRYVTFIFKLLHSSFNQETSTLDHTASSIIGASSKVLYSIL